MPDPAAPAGPRTLSERAALALAAGGVRSSSIRVAPTVHGAGDHGSSRSSSASRASGASRATSATAPTTGPRCTAPTRRACSAWRSSRPPPAPCCTGREHFGWLGAFFALDVLASSARTQRLLGWRPTGPALLDDLERGHHTRASVAA